VYYLSSSDLVLKNASLLDGVRGLGDVLAEEVALPEVGDADFALVAEELAGRNTEDLCKTLLARILSHVCM
jgi:hypothetical protein